MDLEQNNERWRIVLIIAFAFVFAACGGLIGAMLCVAGVMVMMYMPRGAQHP